MATVSGRRFDSCASRRGTFDYDNGIPLVAAEYGTSADQSLMDEALIELQSYQFPSAAPPSRSLASGRRPSSNTIRKLSYCHSSCSNSVTSHSLQFPLKQLSQYSIFKYNMTSLKENRTLSILNAAAAGNYGVLAAIAYAVCISHATAFLTNLKLQRRTTHSTRPRRQSKTLTFDHSTLPINT